MITHRFVSAKPDRPDTSLVRPSDWNNEHNFSVPCSLGGGGVTLTSMTTAYDGTNATQGLGLAAVQFSGVNRIRFGVKVNKAGTGTQSWQLWNETDSLEIGRIDDAGSTGIKTLEVVIDNPAITGIKLIRVRAKSTVAGDSPVYFGGSCLTQNI